MRITETMVLFWRTEDVFSNWHPAVFYENGVRFINTEQHMMWHKAMLFGDTETAAKILRKVHPMDMKQLGREVKGYDDAVWAAKRLEIVTEGNFLKFTQNSAMKAELLATGSREIVEASPVDTIWGVGLDENDPRVEDPANWHGLNLLGEALMLVRARLQAAPIARLSKLASPGVEDGFTADLAGYAAEAAAKVLLQNWETALADGSKDYLVTDIDDVIRQLRLFREHARRELPRANGGSTLELIGSQQSN
ncbi:ADP-L-glycero-D-manno-heptose-6-epimerase [Novimethylophilus kurashikiensis]|uniref:ADP-L-glycero-D-manno-heptose-6-epimerase n=1 Tax=Novimethylophilus kurashikiensis TaxID=1825523 RepID=A0A2R5FAJ1_9PROT|nr:NADAR family protein [Novimethylophilus kurashikiensis]GBG14839.1 ADP-L-glycero-D-manno-heptose-6-epimerase [Novimethylophilus kurashikiensis]